MIDNVFVECLECGERYHIQQSEDSPLLSGDYLELPCPVCEDETEHRVIRGEDPNAD